MIVASNSNNTLNTNTDTNTIHSFISLSYIINKQFIVVTHYIKNAKLCIPIFLILVILCILYSKCTIKKSLKKKLEKKA